jgi:EAL domain-containing protein (putative c-di-GMP-specific phosphodiesterase class I)
LAIEPGVFIPIAEETGLMAPLGHYVLTTACDDLARWHANFPGFRRLGVSVKLSARQAGRADLVDTVQCALNRAGIAPGMLTLELTEAVLIEAGRPTLSALRKIRALGVKIEIDRFGTGYASVRYLAALPVTGLKIDRSLVAAPPRDRTSRTIVRAIAGLAQELDLTCVAVGIETDAQLLALPSRLSGQGYLLGRPVTSTQIAARLDADESRTGAGYHPPYLASRSTPQGSPKTTRSVSERTGVAQTRRRSAAVSVPASRACRTRRTSVPADRGD